MTVPYVERGALERDIDVPRTSWHKETVLGWDSIFGCRIIPGVLCCKCLSKRSVLRQGHGTRGKNALASERVLFTGTRTYAILEKRAVTS